MYKTLCDLNNFGHVISTEKRKALVPKRVLPHLERTLQNPERTLPNPEWALSQPERELPRP